MSVTPAGDVVNYVSFDAPNASYTVSATASTPGDTNPANNTVATPFATAVDQTPLAYDVVNHPAQLPERCYRQHGRPHQDFAPDGYRC